MQAFKNLMTRASASAPKDLSPKGLMAAFKNWIQFQGGVMDNMLPTADKSKTREQGMAKNEPWSYRQPAPASQPHPTIPYREPTEVFDIKYYARDTRRYPSAGTTTDGDYAMLAAEEKKLLEARKAAGEEEGEEAPVNLGSPGNANPDVFRYSDDGLRSTMSATHTALSASIASHEENHQPTVEWAEDADRIVASYEAAGLPPVPGRGLRAFVNERHDPRW